MSSLVETFSISAVCLLGALQSDFFAHGEHVVPVLVAIADGVHHLLAEEDAEPADFSLVGAEGDVGVFFFEGVEGYAGIAQFDGEDEAVVVEACACLEPSDAAVVGVADHVLDGLFDGEPELEAQRLVVGHVGRGHEEFDDFAAFVLYGVETFFHIKVEV